MPRVHRTDTRANGSRSRELKTTDPDSIKAGAARILALVGVHSG